MSRKSSSWKFSENKKFAINVNDASVLLIKPSVDKTPLHPWIVEIDKTTKGYQSYNIVNNFSKGENDCLNFAESLTTGIWGYQKNSCALKEKKSKKVFGDTYEKNIQLASKLGEILNDKANPEVGEVYAIVRKKDLEGDHPYHIAYVIAKDGDTSITVEADAGDPERKTPVFDMYNLTTDTFHSRYKDSFYPASTIVLIKK